MVKEIPFIGEIDRWGLSPNYIRNELSGLGPNDTLRLLVDCPGGSVTHGIAIYNLLKHSKQRIEAVIVGLCASMATVVIGACDSIEAYGNTVFLVHRPSTLFYWDYKNVNDLEEERDILLQMENAMLDSYVRNTSLTEKEFRKKFFDDGKDHVFTAAKAKEYGFIHAIVEDKELDLSSNGGYPAGFDDFDERDKAKFGRYAATINPKVLKLENNLEFNLIDIAMATATKAKEKVESTTNEDQLQELQKKLDDSNAKNKELESKISSLESDIETANALHSTITDERDTLQEQVTALQASMEGSEQSGAELVKAQKEINALKEDLKNSNEELQKNSVMNALKVVFAGMYFNADKEINSAMQQTCSDQFMKIYSVKSEEGVFKIFDKAKQENVTGTLEELASNFALTKGYAKVKQPGVNITSATSSYAGEEIDSDTITHEDEASENQARRDAYTKKLHKIAKEGADKGYMVGSKEMAKFFEEHNMLSPSHRYHSKFEKE